MKPRILPDVNLGRIANVNFKVVNEKISNLAKTFVISGRMSGRTFIPNNPISIF